jgi:hypothetical protein
VGPRAGLDNCEKSLPYRDSFLNNLLCNFHIIYIIDLNKGVLATTAWRVLRLRMEERPPMWRMAANIFNKSLRTADKGLSSSLGVGRGANKSSP